MTAHVDSNDEHEDSGEGRRIRLVPVRRRDGAEADQHRHVGNEREQLRGVSVSSARITEKVNRAHQEDEELVGRVAQADHEVQHQVEDEDGDELERDVDEGQGENVGGRAEHGVAALPDNDGTLRVGRGDLGHSRERIVEDGEAVDERCGGG